MSKNKRFFMLFFDYATTGGKFNKKNIVFFIIQLEIILEYTK